MKSVNLMMAFAMIATVVSLATAAARADYMTEVLADNPFVYLRLEETNVGHTSNASNDGSGSDGTYGIDTGINGSFDDVASPLWTGGVGKRLNGINDNQGSYVDIDQGASVASLSEFTIEMFIRPETYTPGIQALYATYGFNLGAVHFNLINGTTTPAIELAVSGNTAPFPGAVAAPLATGDWVHVAATYVAAGGSNTTTLYVNGSMVGSPIVTTGGSLANFDDGGAFGRWFTGVGNARRFQGSIDELAIYASALSGDDIARHFAASIPAPAALPAGLAMMGLLGLRRRRNH